MTVVGRVMAAGIMVAASIALGEAAQAATVTGQAGFSTQARSLGQGDSSGQITSPSDGEVVSGSSVTVSARTGLMQLSMGLYVEGPSMPTQKVAGGGANKTISGTFDAGSAPNGTFTVTLKGEITGTRYDSRTFKLRRPAEAPGNVNASRQGTDKVLVTWSKGTEPDLQSYEVSNSQSGIVGRLSADSACAGSSCEAALSVPGKAAGQKVGFTVKAFRGDGDGGSIGSNDSAPAYVAFPAPPTAQPKKTAGTQQTPKSRDTKNVDALPTLPAKKRTLPSSRPTTTNRKQTTSRLPDIPDTDPSGNLPIPTADSGAEEQGENGGLVPADAKEGTDSAPVQSDGVKAQSSESPMGNIGQYGIYVAGGILLLLLGGHAGAWARRRALASGGGGGSAPAAPMVPGGGASGGGARTGHDFRGAHGFRADSGMRVGAGAQVSGGVQAGTGAVGGVGATGGADGVGGAGVLGGSGAAGGAGVLGSGAAGGAGMPGSGPGMLSSGVVGGAGVLGGTGAGGGRNGAKNFKGGVEAGQGDAGAALAATARRRPAVILAVAKTRVPEQTQAQPPLAADRVDGEVEEKAKVETPERLAPYGLSDRPRKEVPAVRAFEDDVREVVQEGAAPNALQGPARIALPSSAVTDVPAPSAPVAPINVRLEDRWDDYLPPSPRSMEDSGFWERPQPGAADFWAADDEGDGGAGGNGSSGNDKAMGNGRAYVGRRQQGSES
ncbi:fibronectin type III domain-containing protein [Nonomuraea solani]|uniref:hypothetical protein n=1 Tax=Nonomuraea solani TaxID=1144553 RepID=UPI0011B09978|nr:hypothetical protein [Nonomuraea solani]